MQETQAKISPKISPKTPLKTPRDPPSLITLKDGSAVTLRPMTAFDANRIVSFAQSLPANDLLHLRMDITKPEVVMQWVRNLEEKTTLTVIAEASGKIAGYAILHHNQVTWQRHLGEIRILVGPEYRSHGLGRKLAQEIFAIAHDMGLSRIVAQMTPDQKAAVATFERLGFQPEALLSDFVIDRDGRTSDLMIMAYDVTGFGEHTV
jgi:L-amino acid N-acyltransferase YncA